MYAELPIYNKFKFMGYLFALLRTRKDPIKHNRTGSTGCNYEERL